MGRENGNVDYVHETRLCTCLWRLLAHPCLGKVVQVARTGLYSQEDDLAGMTEEFDDAQEPDWAPNAEADSPGSYGEPGDLSGSKSLKEPSKKRERKGTLRNFLISYFIFEASM